MRKLQALVWLAFVSLLIGVAASPSATAATTGNTAPQTGVIVSDNPSGITPNILNGTVYSIVQIGNMIVVGGQFSQVQNANSTTTLTRNNVFAFNATTGNLSTTFVPNPNSTVYKVQAAADGTSVYVGGRFSSAAGRSMPSRLFEANAATGAVDTGFAPATFSGDIRDMEVVGNRLWVAGKFTHIGGVAQKALGTLNATTGKKDSYFTGVMAGLHRNNHPEDRTNVLQISSNPENTQLTVVGNFTSVNGVSRSQAARFDISAGPHRRSWPPGTRACSRRRAPATSRPS